MAAWIPSESIAVFVGLASSFAVFDELWEELFVVVVVGCLTAFLAYVSSQASAKRRNKKIKRKSLQTAALALIAFILWWIATPGSAPATDWGVNPLITTTVLILGVVGIPHLAKKLKIDPSSINTAEPAQP